MLARATRRFLTLALVLFIAATAFAADTRQLVADISGSDLGARIRARQLLPREGVDALEPLLPLLANDDQSIRYTARNVIADVLNAAAAPGHEADQLRAAHLMMSTIAPNNPPVELDLGLRLLTIVVPEGFDVGPIAALLTNADYGEKARACLQAINTDNACTALLDAIPGADPTFTVALLDAVGKMQKARSIEPVRALASDNDPAIRAAAAMALSWTGDVDLAPLLQDVAAKATPETQFEAYDALLRLTGGIATKGGNWDLAMSLYKSVLQSAPPGIIQAGAVMGLGRYGDATVVDTIVAAAASGNGHMQDSIVQALASLQGREAVQAVIKAYPSLPEPIRVGLINVWGQRSETLAVDLIKSELSSGSPVLHQAALHALASMQSMKAFASLVDVARNGSDDEKNFAMSAVKSIAGSLGDAGDAKAAGLAYMQLYNLAATDDDDLHRTCLLGLSRYPVGQSYDLVKAALDNAALKDAAVEALVSVTGVLAKDDKAKAQEALNLVRNVDTSPEMLVRLAKNLQGAGVPADLSNLLGVVKVWRIVGPFDWKSDADWDATFVGEPNIDLNASYTVGGKTLKWKPVTTPDPLGHVDLIGAVAQRDRCFAYAYTEVDVPEETDAQIRLGSDDGNKVWLNGAVVWENRVDRGAALDQDIADVHLVKGRNRILVKISQGGGGWGFNLRIAESTGAGVQFTPVEPGS